MIRRVLFVLAMHLVIAAPLAAQTHPSTGSNAYALVELPALALAVVFGFLTARALRGGRLGKGMALIAWGFLVMAIGHLHMQGEMLFGFNLFETLLGQDVGQAIWVIALLVTWILTGLGFYRLYRASASV
ncbi:MAG TPA: hypothetical protein VF167_02025 [Longimicrobiaceae bacterium]